MGSIPSSGSCWSNFSAISRARSTSSSRCSTSTGAPSSARSTSAAVRAPSWSSAYPRTSAATRV